MFLTELRRLKRWMTRTPEQSFGLNQLDMKVKPYIGGCAGFFSAGFFIEAGGNDGLDQSNTAYFEKYRGWRGVLIEPVPELAQRCRQNRPRSRVFNAALVPFDYTAETIKLRYANLMSLVEGAKASEAEELEHVRFGCEIQNIETQELVVPARTLTSVLDEARVDRIDFFSLDVEGFELGVLRGLDLDRYRPAWMLIEAWDRAGIDAFLRGMYEPETLLSHHDVLYRRLNS